MNKFFQEFKQFISKGNVIDLAIGVIIGTAFSKIVTSLVNDIVMPLIGGIMGQNSFTDLKWIIRAGTETTTELAVRYGAFIQTFVDFFIIALSVFIALKVLMKSQERFKEATQTISQDFKKLTKKERKNQKENKTNDAPKEEVVAVEEKQTIGTKNENISENESTQAILKDIRDLLKDNRG